MSYHLADGIVYALQSLVITANAVGFDIPYDIERCEFHNRVVRIIIAVIVDGDPLNFLIF
jgi:hypothetical protein